MRLSAESAGHNLIRSCEPGAVHLADRTIRTNVIITSQTVVTDWSATTADRLSIEDFAAVLELEPEVILLGTGDEQVFPDIAVLTSILQHGIAIEVMTTHAACSTFNVLAAEKRAVAAALIVGAAAGRD